MTSDSDDVAESANEKPEGALRPRDPRRPPGRDEHPTGAAQAAENQENDPPA